MRAARMAVLLGISIPMCAICPAGNLPKESIREMEGGSARLISGSLREMTGWDARFRSRPLPTDVGIASCIGKGTLILNKRDFRHIHEGAGKNRGRHDGQRFTQGGFRSKRDSSGLCGPFFAGRARPCNFPCGRRRVYQGLASAFELPRLRVEGFGIGPDRH